MISIRYNQETDGFQIKGTVNLGIIGTFENKEYEDNNICIRYPLSILLGAVMDKKTKLLGDLYDYLKDGPEDGDAVAKILQDYYNKKIQELNQNIKQFNDLIWSQLFDWLLAIGFPFWEDERAIAPQYRGRDWSKEVEQLYTEKQDEILEILEEYTNSSPNNGTIQKPDVEKKMREYFYMFNFDGLMENIIRKYLGFHFDFITMEFEDNWDSSIFCSTVCSLSGDFSLREWNNF